MKYSNPVVPGFFPDPSVCRVEDTYYLVCSSFNYFPGVPLFESKDLVNWSPIGHVLTRKSQLDLTDSPTNGGIYAPTIRYHQGRFYMVTTNVDHGGNFYVWTDNIYGEWSDPIWVDQDGIDPSFYFEGDTAYFMSNGTDDEGKSGICQCTLDIKTGKKLTPTKCIWQGAGGRYLEGPHLYKVADKYLLVASEGGTEYGHMLVCAKSDQIYGPYENDPDNPILTNRNLGGYQIQGCGHADLVSDLKGNWWFIHLAFRQLDRWQQQHVTGREVYLVPVTFIDGWPKVGHDGTTRAQFETDRIASDVSQSPVPNLTLANSQIGNQWLFLQNPDLANYDLSQLPEQVGLQGTTVTMDAAKDSPTFLGTQQRGIAFTLKTKVQLTAGEAGITAYMTDEQHYDLAVRKTATGFELFRRIRLGEARQEDHLISLPSDTDQLEVTLILTGSPDQYSFTAATQGQTYQLGTATTKYLSSEVAGNFTGVMLGIYAQKSADAASSWANFSQLVYQNQD
ncbi:glycoside hydrolase family 43 protein [Lapidilactobacillus wuchangensis]|uniref:glycoside hydrolase family 43 protein n=1 Tax=Lapidilactobacillus wuchangensis TaxID=2486001 RepID=UPI000F7AE263|nr:glycoside hydrolase family 43 protein [Lapidilactobacillus wuchangensis]